MAITWDIKEIKINDNNGVTYVHYFAWDEEVTGEGLNSRSYHGYYDGFVEYAPDAESEGYTTFNDLTKEQVLGWVKETLGSDMVNTIESAIATQIEDRKQIEGPVAFPWGNS